MKINSLLIFHTKGNFLGELFRGKELSHMQLPLRLIYGVNTDARLLLSYIRALIDSLRGRPRFHNQIVPCF